MNRKIYFEVGHGGKDIGGTSISSLTEKSINLLVALEIEKIFYCHNIHSENKIFIKFSRLNDKDINLNEVVKDCNNFNPDICIGIHHNAYNGEREGYEIINSGGVDSIKLANCIGNSFSYFTKKGRGIYKDERGLALIKRVKSPSIITEYCYIDNENDYKRLDVFIEALTLYFGIIDYFKDDSIIYKYFKILKKINSTNPILWVKSFISNNYETKIYFNDLIKLFITYIELGGN